MKKNWYSVLALLALVFALSGHMSLYRADTCGEAVLFMNHFFHSSSTAFGEEPETENTPDIDEAPVTACPSTQTVTEYSTPNNAVEASVLPEASGSVSIHSAGEAVTSVTSFNGKRDSKTITVLPTPETLRFANATPTCYGVRQTQQLSLVLPEGTTGEISFASDAPDCASVSADGILTAVAPGTAHITAAFAPNGVSATLEVTVVPEPKTIDILESSVRLCVKQTLSAPFSVALDNGLESGYRFKSSNTGRVKVNALTGALTGVKKGSATITVTAYNGKKASCKVTVYPAPSKLTLTAPRTTLGVGEETSFTVGCNKGAWPGITRITSNHPEILSVGSDLSSVCALSAGEAELTVESFNGKKARLSFSVLNAPVSVRPSQTELTLGVGQSIQLSAAVNEGAAGACRFSGGDKTASVSEDGLVTGLREGTAVLRVSSYVSTVFSEIRVTVLPAPTSVSFQEKSVSIGLKETVSDALHVVLSEGSCASLRYKSSNTRYVKVDSVTGALTGAKKGSATITVTTQNRKSARIKVTVCAAPSSVSISAAMPVFSVGQTQRVSVRLSKGSAGGWTLSSSNSSVVSVEGDTLRALKAGTAEIRVSSYNKKSGSCKVSVVDAPASLIPETDTLTIGVGLSANAVFRIPEDSYASFSYDIDDPSIAVVDQEGCVTGVSAGEAQLTARIQNGLTASMRICVQSAPESIVLASDSLTLGLGETYSLTPQALPENSIAGFSFSSGSSSVVRVSEKGLLSARKKGSATITITAQNGVSAKLNVLVIDYTKLHEPISIAHRGASAYFEGNTLAAFLGAAKYDADMVELDVRRTKDGVIIVHHDANLSSASGISVPISSLSFGQIQALNPEICSLEQALEAIRSINLEVQIEIKDADIEIDVVRCVMAAGMNDVVYYGSFSLDTINTIKSLRKDFKTVLILSSRTMASRIQKNAASFSCDVFSFSYALLSRDLVQAVHLAGKQAYCWTCNTRSEIATARSFGMDGIITDYPDWVHS